VVESRSAPTIRIHGSMLVITTRSVCTRGRRRGVCGSRPRSRHRLPHREKYLLIVVGFLRRLLDLHEQLVDEVERELVTTSPAQSPERV
jgi:hypothetical protein